MGQVFFSVIKLTFILIILGIEFYFFALQKIIEKEITIGEILSFLLLLNISILLIVKKGLLLVSLLVIPAGFGLIRCLEKIKENLTTKEIEEKRLKELEEIVQQQPNNYKAYEELGDYYFNKEVYSEAVKFYKIAYKLKDFPMFKHKLEVAERELKIKEGIIWICRNCGETNSKENERCRNCGEEKKVLKSIIKDLKKEKKSLLYYFMYLLALPIIVVITILVIFYLPLYLSVFLFLFILYLVFRFFLTF
jgi:tetratricopeptide (TPR) repeat protein